MLEALECRQKDYNKHLPIVGALKFIERPVCPSESLRKPLEEVGSRPGARASTLDNTNGLSATHTNTAFVSRARLARFQADYAPLTSYKMCKRALIPHKRGELSFNSKHQRASWKGLMTCNGSDCVWCYAKVRSCMLSDSVRALKWASSQNNTIMFATFTQRTHYLPNQIKALNSGIKAVNDYLLSKTKRAGIKFGASVGLDVTFNIEASTAHKHSHNIYVFDTCLDEEMIKEFISGMKSSYIEATIKTGSPRPLPAHQHIEVVTKADERLAKYITKADALESDEDVSKLACEVYWDKTKEGKKGLSLYQLMALGIQGVKGAIKLYQHYLLSSHRKKKYRTTKQMIAFANLYEEEEEVVALACEDEEVIITRVPFSNEFFDALVSLRLEGEAFELFESNLQSRVRLEPLLPSNKRFLKFIELCSTSVIYEKTLSREDWKEIIIDSEVFPTLI
tara:strand:+ start:16 stop:1371 length:1356 start_codon:yes stop_codon:yes gene_type:complete